MSTAVPRAALVRGERGRAAETSPQSAEGASWVFLAAYGEMREERNKLRKDLLSKKYPSAADAGNSKPTRLKKMLHLDDPLEGSVLGRPPFAPGEELRHVTHGPTRRSQRKPGVEAGFPGKVCVGPSHEQRDSHPHDGPYPESTHSCLIIQVISETEERMIIR